MKTIFLFHGLGGSPDSNWLPWIQKQDEFKNVEFIAPRFPNPKNPYRAEWLAHVNKLMKEDVSNTYLVGHSLGGAFIIYFLQQWHGFMPFAGSLLIGAPYISQKYAQEYPELIANGFFDFDTVDFSGIIEKSCSWDILHSTDDSIVSVGDAESLGKKLQTKPHVVDNEGHFTAKESQVIKQQIQKCIENEK